MVISKEQYYDNEIAPVLKRLADSCAAHDISFVAAVDLDDMVAETSILVMGYSFAINMVAFAIQAKGNVDAMVMSCYRWAKLQGNIETSIILHRIHKDSAG